MRPVPGARGCGGMRTGSVCTLHAVRVAYCLLANPFGRVTWRRGVTGPGQRGDPAPRLAWTFVAAFLFLVLPTRLANAAYWAGPSGVAAAATLFVLPLLYIVPRG